MARIRGLSAGPSDGRTDSFKKDIHIIYTQVCARRKALQC
jgi:hypothetical protein